MLRGELGDARFWRSIGHYVEQNAQRNVETIDLIRAIEEATGRNMRGFFDQWVFRGGHPEIEVSVAWDAQRKAATVTIDQKQTIDDEHPPYRFGSTSAFARMLPAVPRPIAGPGPLAGETPHSRRDRTRARDDYVPLDFEPKLVRFDPGAWLLGSITYKLGATFAARRCAAIPIRWRAFALRANWPKTARRRRGRHCRPRSIAIRSGACSKKRQRRSAQRAHRGRARCCSVPSCTRASQSSPRGRGGARELPQRGCRERVARSAARRRRLVFCPRGGACGAGKDARSARLRRAASQRSRRRSWNGTIEAGAARGLAELADARAVDAARSMRRASVATKVCAASRSARSREPASCSNAPSARGSSMRSCNCLDDPMFLVQLAAIAAAEGLEDASCARRARSACKRGFDGRIRRDAAEAAIRIREAAESSISSERSALGSR